MMVIKKILLTLIFCFALCSLAGANNLQVTNLDEVSVNTQAGNMTFSFNLTQDNSWRNGSNFDAVWIFMKYSTDGGATWKHATMAGSGTNPAGFTIPTQFQNQFEIFVPPSDKRGFFVQRSSPTNGNVSINLTGVQFVWNYGLDLGAVNSVTAAQAQSANTLHTIYGIEMVYIPQGAFYAGDGSANEFAFGTQSGSTSTPWYIQSENAFQTTANAGSGTYYYQSTGANGETPSGSAFWINSSFPKGFGAFYLMKYQLTEGQWVAFFNSLPNSVKPYRDITANSTLGAIKVGGKGTQAVVNRNTITWNSKYPSSPAISMRPSRPVSFVSWPDVAAYAAWAALRPITELEYEKAARGADNFPAPGEYVWGSSQPALPSASDIYPNADENGSEVLSSLSNINAGAVTWKSGDGRAGAIADSQSGPLRVGIFAASITKTTATRVNTGSGAYGNMELTGNLAEPVVTVGRPQGLSFKGSNGTGSLSQYGFATNDDWPGYDKANNAVDSTVGIGYRGGDFQSPNSNVYATSARFYAVKDPDSQSCIERYDSNPNCDVFQGGRLGRSAS